MSTFFSIKIPEPCSKDWNTMTPNEKGRFCNACSKTVIDFTKMNTFEIQDFITMNKGKSICGHIKQSQLDSINLQIPIQSIHKDLRFHKLFLYALLITMGTSLFSCVTDNGSIKKINSIEVVDTTLKTLDSIPEKNCDTKAKTIENINSCKTSRTIDSTTQKNHKTKAHKIINVDQLVDGEIIIETVHQSICPVEEPTLIGDIDYPEEDELFFNLHNVDSAPEFENTSKALNKEEKKQYFQDTLRDFVTTNFNAPDHLGLTGKTKTYIQFEINNVGEITILKSRSAHPHLEKEAKRVLHLLPVFKPARHNNKAVSILYNLPITINFE